MKLVLSMGKQRKKLGSVQVQRARDTPTSTIRVEELYNSPADQRASLKRVCMLCGVGCNCTTGYGPLERPVRRHKHILNHALSRSSSTPQPA